MQDGKWVSMLLSDLTKMAVRQVYRNRRRYRGVVLGISLGICGLVAVLTAGDSVQSAIGVNLEILGSATIVKAEWDSSPTGRWHVGEYRDKDIEDIKKLPGVLAVSATCWGGEKKVVYEKKKTTARIGGFDAAFFRVRYLPVARGRKITEEDVKEKRQVCLVGQDVETDLFGVSGWTPNQRVFIHGIAYEVLGVLGGMEDPEFSRTVMVPLTVAIGKIRGMKGVTALYARAVNWDVVPILSAQMETILKRNQPGYADSMVVSYYADRISSLKAIAFLFKFFLISSIVVTLLLGSLGITNVMLSVVRERTTEIGLRKAVGATNGIILLQFLCESLAVSLIGALAGIVMGVIAVEVLERILATGSDAQTLFLSLLGSVGIGILLGVVSGVLPARRAGSLDPVDAMRFE